MERSVSEMERELQTTELETKRQGSAASEIEKLKQSETETKRSEESKVKKPREGNEDLVQERALDVSGPGAWMGDHGVTGRGWDDTTGSNGRSPSATLPHPAWAWGGLTFHLGLPISSSFSSRLQVWGSQHVEENIFPLLLPVVFLLSGLLSGLPSGKHSRKILKTNHLQWPPVGAI